MGAAWTPCVSPVVSVAQIVLCHLNCAAARLMSHAEH